jgi:hypothetical protein
MTQKKKRVPIPNEIAAAVLFSADRTCCVCRTRRKPVQIHHIDDNPSNNDIANLAVLCFECHNETQIKGGFGRRLNAELMRLFRDDWNKIVVAKRSRAYREATDPLNASSNQSEIDHVSTSIHEMLVLESVLIVRNTPSMDKFPEYNGLTFYLNFHNEASIPIRYSMRWVTFIIDSVELPFPEVGLDHSPQRIGAGASRSYVIPLGFNLHPPRSGTAAGSIRYCIWYGASSEPELYEQQGQMGYRNWPELGKTTTSTQYLREPGGYDIRRTAVSDA